VVDKVGRNFRLTRDFGGALPRSSNRASSFEPEAAGGIQGEGHSLEERPAFGRRARPGAVSVLAGYYPATRKGLTPYDVTQDYGKAAQAWLECNRDLQADTMIAPVFAAIPDGRMKRST